MTSILSSKSQRWVIPLVGIIGWDIMTYDSTESRSLPSFSSFSTWNSDMLLLKATAEPLFGKLMTTKKRLTEMSLHEKWDYFALFASNPGEDDDDDEEDDEDE